MFIAPTQEGDQENLIKNMSLEAKTARKLRKITEMKNHLLTISWVLRVMI